MPPSKKPPGTAVDPRNGAKLALLPVAPDVIPDCPAGLLKASESKWDAYWNDAISGLIQPSEVGLVERWITYTDEWQRALVAFRKDRFIQGSTGQPKLNPLAGYIKGLESDITAIEDRLGLSPKARLALGIAVGAAQKSLADLNAALEVPDDDDLDGVTYVDISPYPVPHTGTEGRAVD